VDTSPVDRGRGRSCSLRVVAARIGAIPCMFLLLAVVWSNAFR
jgi:hypothetical protein